MINDLSRFNRDLRFKMRFFLIIAIFLFVFVLIVLFLFLLKREGRENLSEKLSSQLTLPTPVASSDKTVPSLTGWKPYKTAQFSFRYPPDWKIKEFQVVGGGALVYVRPVNSNSDDYFPRIDIMSYSVRSSASAKQKAQYYEEALKLSSKEIVFHNAPAIMLSGIPSGKFMIDNPEKKQIYQTYIFFQEKGLMYDIKYAYFQDTNQTQYRQVIDKVLDSFSFVNNSSSAAN